RADLTPRAKHEGAEEEAQKSLIEGVELAQPCRELRGASRVPRAKPRQRRFAQNRLRGSLDVAALRQQPGVERKARAEVHALEQGASEGRHPRALHPRP